MTDELYQDAVRFVRDTGYASTSLLQRQFCIGYGRAVNLIDLLESAQVIGPATGPGPRSVRPVVPPETSGDLFA